MKRPIVFAAVLSFLFIYIFLPKSFTGFAVQRNVSISIGQVLKGEITGMTYKNVVEFSSVQNISIEFTNVGSIPLTEKIEVRIYFNNQTKLQEMAYYYDSPALLIPGQRRIYTVSFFPPQLGVYYLKARVEYDSRVREKWGAFLVTYTPPIQIITPSPPSMPSVSVKEVGLLSMSLKYPEKVEIPQGETKVFNISVNNTGEVSLNNIKLFISTTSLIEVETNPKQVFKLMPGNSTLFLVSINASKTPPGKYPFDFEVVTDETKEGRSIELIVTSIAPPLKEEVYETILNYEYLISEIQSEINSTALRGIDVSIPQNTLNEAKTSLEAAKEYYQQGNYENAKIKLEEVRKYLEDAVYQLASVSITVYLPAYAPFPVVLVAILLGMAFFLLILLTRRKRKEKEKRPKLLRAVETEG